MPAILFDMDGVLYVGDRPTDGAAETLAWCRRHAIPFRFVTNTTSRPRTALVDKLDAMGIEARADEIITPPVAARQWLSRHVDGPVGLFVPEATRAEFADCTPASPRDERVAAIVLGDLGEGWDFATYNRAFRWLKQNPDAPLVALGLTRFWEAEDGPRLDVGPFVRGLEYTTGREAVVLGKPSAAFYGETLRDSMTSLRDLQGSRCKAQSAVKGRRPLQGLQRRRWALGGPPGWGSRVCPHSALPSLDGQRARLRSGALIADKPASQRCHRIVQSFPKRAVEQLGVPADQTLMIGDDIVGDVGGAQGAGLKAVLVRTGKFRPTDLDGDISADGVIDSIADLPTWWERESPP
ncbi:MAG: HAD hydrolase-like protein [Halothiobacillaceae bacterium]|nr:HAD hydrolase-like protein [Halothiobacillaceae bacterium]